MNRITVALGLTVLIGPLLGGCISTEIPDQIPAEPSIADPLVPLFSECSTWSAFQRTIPAALISDEIPVEWQTQSHVNSVVDFTVIDCEQLVWGPFTLGPVQLAFLTHSRINPPDLCRMGQPGTNPFFMYGAWISDGEIATWAEKTLGMPLRAAEVTSSTGSLGNLHSKRWDVIDADSGTHNWFNFEWQNLNEQTGSTGYSFYWHQQTTGRLDFTEEFLINTPQSLTSRGYIHPPMIAPFSSGMDWSAINAVSFDVKMNANIVTFEGPLCETQSD